MSTQHSSNDNDSILGNLENLIGEVNDADFNDEDFSSDSEEQPEIEPIEIEEEVREYQKQGGPKHRIKPRATFKCLFPGSKLVKYGNDYKFVKLGKGEKANSSNLAFIHCRSSCLNGSEFLDLPSLCCVILDKTLISSLISCSSETLRDRIMSDVWRGLTKFSSFVRGIAREINLEAFRMSLTDQNERIWRKGLNHREWIWDGLEMKYMNNGKRVKDIHLRSFTYRMLYKSAQSQPLGELVAIEERYQQMSIDELLRLKIARECKTIQPFYDLRERLKEINKYDRNIIKKLSRCCLTNCKFTSRDAELVNCLNKTPRNICDAIPAVLIRSANQKMTSGNLINRGMSIIEEKDDLTRLDDDMNLYLSDVIHYCKTCLNLGTVTMAKQGGSFISANKLTEAVVLLNELSSEENFRQSSTAISAIIGNFGKMQTIVGEKYRLDNSCKEVLTEIENYPFPQQHKALLLSSLNRLRNTDPDSVEFCNRVLRFKGQVCEAVVARTLGSSISTEEDRPNLERSLDACNLLSEDVREEISRCNFTPDFIFVSDEQDCLIRHITKESEQEGLLPGQKLVIMEVYWSSVNDRIIKEATKYKELLRVVKEKNLPIEYIVLGLESSQNWITVGLGAASNALKESVSKFVSSMLRLSSHDTKSIVDSAISAQALRGMHHRPSVKSCITMSKENKKRIMDNFINGFEDEVIRDHVNDYFNNGIWRCARGCHRLSIPTKDDERAQYNQELKDSISDRKNRTANRFVETSKDIKNLTNRVLTLQEEQGLFESNHDAISDTPLPRIFDSTTNLDFYKKCQGSTDFSLKRFSCKGKVRGRVVQYLNKLCMLASASQGKLVHVDFRGTLTFINSKNLKTVGTYHQDASADPEVIGKTIKDIRSTFNQYRKRVLDLLPKLDEQQEIYRRSDFSKFSEREPMKHCENHDSDVSDDDMEQEEAEPNQTNSESVTQFLDEITAQFENSHTETDYETYNVIKAAQVELTSRDSLQKDEDLLKKYTEEITLTQIGKNFKLTEEKRNRIKDLIEYLEGEDNNPIQSTYMAALGEHLAVANSENDSMARFTLEHIEHTYQSLVRRRGFRIALFEQEIARCCMNEFTSHKKKWESKVSLHYLRYCNLMMLTRQCGHKTRMLKCVLFDPQQKMDMGPDIYLNKKNHEGMSHVFIMTERGIKQKDAKPSMMISRHLMLQDTTTWSLPGSEEFEKITSAISGEYYLFLTKLKRNINIMNQNMRYGFMAAMSDMYCDGLPKKLTATLRCSADRYIFEKEMNWLTEIISKRKTLKRALMSDVEQKIAWPSFFPHIIEQTSKSAIDHIYEHQSWDRNFDFFDREQIKVLNKSIEPLLLFLKMDNHAKLNAAGFTCPKDVGFSQIEGKAKVPSYSLYFVRCAAEHHNNHCGSNTDWMKKISDPSLSSMGKNSGKLSKFKETIDWKNFVSRVAGDEMIKASLLSGLNSDKRRRVEQVGATMLTKSEMKRLKDVPSRVSNSSSSKSLASLLKGNNFSSARMSHVLKSLMHIVDNRNWCISRKGNLMKQWDDHAGKIRNESRNLLNELQIDEDYSNMIAIKDDLIRVKETDIEPLKKCKMLHDLVKTKWDEAFREFTAYIIANWMPALISNDESCRVFIERKTPSYVLAFCQVLLQYWVCGRSRIGVDMFKVEEDNNVVRAFASYASRDNPKAAALLVLHNMKIGSESGFNARRSLFSMEYPHGRDRYNTVLLEFERDNAFEGLSLFQVAGKLIKRTGSHIRVGISPKVQEGDARELSILFVEDSLLQQAAEGVMLAYDTTLTEEMLANPQTEGHFMKLARKAFQRNCKREKGESKIYQGSLDNATWGPGHSVYAFAALILGLENNFPEEAREFCAYTWLTHVHKKIEIPNSVIQKLAKWESRINLGLVQERELNDVEQYLLGQLRKGRTYYEKHVFDMLQGIPHNTSSNYGVITGRYIEHILKKDHPDTNIESVESSDDQGMLVTGDSKCEPVCGMMNEYGCYREHSNIKISVKSVMSGEIMELKSIFKMGSSIIPAVGKFLGSMMMIQPVVGLSEHLCSNFSAAKNAFEHNATWASSLHCYVRGTERLKENWQTGKMQTIAVEPLDTISVLGGIYNPHPEDLVAGSVTQMDCERIRNMTDERARKLSVFLRPGDVTSGSLFSLGTCIKPISHQAKSAIMRVQESIDDLSITCNVGSLLQSMLRQSSWEGSQIKYKRKFSTQSLLKDKMGSVLKIRNIDFQIARRDFWPHNGDRNLRTNVLDRIRSIMQSNKYSMSKINQVIDVICGPVSRTKGQDRVFEDVTYGSTTDYIQKKPELVSAGLCLRSHPAAVVGCLVPDLNSIGPQPEEGDLRPSEKFMNRMEEISGTTVDLSTIPSTSVRVGTQSISVKSIDSDTSERLIDQICGETACGFAFLRQIPNNLWNEDIGYEVSKVGRIAASLDMNLGNPNVVESLVMMLNNLRTRQHPIFLSASDFSDSITTWQHTTSFRVIPAAYVSSGIREMSVLRDDLRSSDQIELAINDSISTCAYYLYHCDSPNSSMTKSKLLHFLSNISLDDMIRCRNICHSNETSLSERVRLSVQGVKADSMDMLSIIRSSVDHKKVREKTAAKRAALLTFLGMMEYEPTALNEDNRMINVKRFRWDKKTMYSASSNKGIVTIIRNSGTGDANIIVSRESTDRIIVDSLNRIKMNLFTEDRSIGEWITVCSTKPYSEQVIYSEESDFKIYEAEREDQDLIIKFKRSTTDMKSFIADMNDKVVWSWSGESLFATSVMDDFDMPESVAYKIAEEALNNMDYQITDIAGFTPRQARKRRFDLPRMTTPVCSQLSDLKIGMTVPTVTTDQAERADNLRKKINNLDNMQKEELLIMTQVDSQFKMYNRTMIQDVLTENIKDIESCNATLAKLKSCRVYPGSTDYPIRNYSLLFAYMRRPECFEDLLEGSYRLLYYQPEADIGIERARSKLRLCRDSFEISLLGRSLRFQLNENGTEFVSQIMGCSELDEALLPGFKAIGIDAFISDKTIHLSRSVVSFKPHYFSTEKYVPDDEMMSATEVGSILTVSGFEEYDL